MKRLLFSLAICTATGVHAQVSYYLGEWTKVNTQANFSALLKLEVSDTDVNADIIWTYLSIDSSDLASVQYYQDKKGKMGIEYTRGQYSPTTHDIIFEGIAKSDPDFIIGLDKYILKLSLNRQVIYGETYSNGDKDGLVYFIRNNDPSLVKAFEQVKQSIKERTKDKAMN